MRFAVAVLLLVSSAAFAQSGSNTFATWATERVNGKAVTTFTPAPGRPGLPSTHVRPDAIGGISRSVAADASWARWSKAIGVPFTSAHTGAAQTLAANVARQATKTAVIDAAVAATKVTNPAGWVLLSAGLFASYMSYDTDNKRLMTYLKPETSEQPEQPPGYVWQFSFESVSRQSTDINDALAQVVAITFPDGGCRFMSSSNRQCFVGWYPGHPYMQPGGGNAYIATQTYSCVDYGSCTPLPGTDPQQGYHQRLTGCPSGWTLENGVCVGPASESCPSGYTYALDFFYGGFECKPAAGTTPTPLVAPDGLIAAMADQAIGNNGAALEQLLNDLPGEGPGIEAPFTSPAASGASSLTPSSTTTNMADGGRIETSVTHPVTYINNIVTIGDTITTTTYNSNNEVINQTTTDGGNAQFPEDYATRAGQCGAPGFPPCKIDEEGTPTVDDLKTAADGAGGGLEYGGPDSVYKEFDPDKLGAPSEVVGDRANRNTAIVAMFGNGSCSAMQWPLPTGGTLTFDWCPAFDWLRPFIAFVLIGLTIIYGYHRSSDMLAAD